MKKTTVALFFLTILVLFPFHILGFLLLLFVLAIGIGIIGITIVEISKIINSFSHKN